MIEIFKQGIKWRVSNNLSRPRRVGIERASHMAFCVNALEDIIESFRKEKLVFSNESQFQFELGRALEKEGYKVFFEVLSLDERKSNSKSKKVYTDIIIDLGSNEYVAIELKYKTAGKPSKKTDGFNDSIGAFCYRNKTGSLQYMFPQGAKNEGLYFYLKDVERLESFARKDITFNFDKNKRIVKAFAIIMANSRKDSSATYWSSQEGNTCSAFSLCQGNIVHGCGLKWADTSSAKDWPPINIQGTYVCDWIDYYPNHDYPIKYMVFEILP